MAFGLNRLQMELHYWHLWFSSECQRQDSVCAPASTEFLCLPCLSTLLPQPCITQPALHPPTFRLLPHATFLNPGLAVTSVCQRVYSYFSPFSPALQLVCKCRGCFYCFPIFTLSRTCFSFMDLVRLDLGLIPAAGCCSQGTSIYSADL